MEKKNKEKKRIGDCLFKKKSEKENKQVENFIIISI